MFGNSPFGFSGSGGGGGGGTIGGGGTLNYLCKFTPDGTTIGNSQLFDDGTSVGLGTITPTAKFQIYVDVNDITGQSGQLITNVNAGTSAAAALFFRNNDNKGFEIGVVSSNHTTYQDAYGRLSDSFYTSVVGGGDMIFKQRASGKGIKFFNAGNGVVTGQSLMNVSDNGVGFYTDSISAVVHIKGVDATSGAYALKVDNSASSPLLYVRNDGNVGIGTSTPTSKLHVLTNSTDYVQLKVGNSNGNYATGLELGTSVSNTPTIYKIGSSATGIASDYYNKMVFAYGGANNAITTDFVFALSDNLSIGSTFRVVNDGGNLNNGFSRTIFGVYGGVTNNSVGVGMGSSIPTARLHVQGIDATSGNFALKVDNSASSPLLYVRNDGNIGIGYSNPSFAKVQVENSINDLKASWFSINSNAGTSSGQQIYMDNGVQSFSSGILGVSTTAWNSYGNAKDAFIRYGSADGTTGNINFISPLSGLGGAYNFFAYRAVSGGIPTLGIKGSYVSVNLNIASASANIHIKGDDSTSSNYSLKVDNSASSPLFYVRNDGLVTVIDMTVGRGGSFISSNTAIGVSALAANTTGSSNTSVGNSSLFSNTTGNENTAIGYSALSANTEGISNVAIGDSSLLANTIGNTNTAIGVSAGAQNIGDGNVFIGNKAGFNRTTDSNKLFIDNTDRGSATADLTDSLIVGTFAATPSSQELFFNAQKINVNYLQVGNAGLSSGDLYVDTAENILENGDYVVGRKV